MILKNFSKFVSIHLTKWHQEKKGGNNIPFLIKNYLAHTKKNATKKSLPQKRSYQNKMALY